MWAPVALDGSLHCWRIIVRRHGNITLAKEGNYLVALTNLTLDQLQSSTLMEWTMLEGFAAGNLNAYRTRTERNGPRSPR